jgi:hypothetical protein
MIEKFKHGLGLVAEEFQRQRKMPGRTWQHDDKQTNDELRDAGIAYAMVCDYTVDNPPECWPFSLAEFQYSADKVENLVKAGAFIVAEIDRHYRAFQRACNEITKRDYGFECFDAMDAYDLHHLEWVGLTPEEFVMMYFSDMMKTIDQEDHNDPS